jgi:Lipocalin-like domain
MKTSARVMVVALSSLVMALAIPNTSLTLRAQTSIPTTVASASSLVGSWTLTAADDLLPDGTRVHAYGSNPQGILVFETDGRYTLQIFREDRMKFASGDKRHGTPDEYKDASVGMSCHFGHYTVDSVKGTITFKIDRASFANWDGATQTRPFSLKGDELEWHVPATPDGKVPISAWRRVKQDQ